jgi:arogenate dehydrogenase (NADP+)
MVEMTCEEHDRQAASTQFVTHTVGRMLGAMDLASTDINTKGYENLLQLVNNTKNDSFELYYGLFLYNTNATGKRGMAVEAAAVEVATAALAMAA